MILAVVPFVLAVFLFASLLIRITTQALERLQERYGVKERGELGDLLLVLDRTSLWVGAASLGTLFALVVLVPLGWVASLFAFLATFVGCPMAVGVHRRRWLAKLEAQLADGLQSVGAALHAGLSLQRALEQLAEETQRPLGKELAVVIREAKLGRSLDDALDRFSRRIPSEDVELVVVSIGVARQLGGNLSEMLQGIAGTTRERIRLGGKIRALTAQGKMQAWIIAALPLCLGLAMVAIRPDLVEPMAAHPAGWGLAALVLTMEAVGLLLIRRIVEIRV